MNKKIVCFILALTVQAAILAAVPAKQIYTRLTGKTIFIKTAPVDPYSLLSGYYVILNYEIARPPGWSDIQRDYKKGQPAYVVLKQNADETWSAESVHDRRPEDIPADRIVIKGRRQRWRGIAYGVESYYIPEKSRQQIEQDLRENAGKARAEIKVDHLGNATLIKLHIEDRTYEY